MDFPFGKRIAKVVFFFNTAKHLKARNIRFNNF